MELRVLLLADINSPHTQKWALGLAADNIEVGIFSFNHSETDWYQQSKHIHCLSQASRQQKNNLLTKSGYLFYLPELLRQIRLFKPNVLHAHYATSYGLLGALSGFKPFIVSAWGSDVMDFPRKGILQNLMLRCVFLRAGKICVTSATLATQVAMYSRKTAHIIPFGVNLNEFYNFKNSRPANVFTFGCVKHFEKVYNIDKVVRAFDMLVSKYPNAVLQLKLIGDGSQRSEIEKLVREHGLSSLVEFAGRVSHHEVPQYLNAINVLVNVSEYESFGVAVAEAMACKVPVIVSNSDGFRDLVPEAENAIVTASTSPMDIFLAMESYYLSAERREIAAKKSYDLILKKFNWLDNLKQMEQVYNEMAVA